MLGTVKASENNETSERPVKTRHETVYCFKSNQFGKVY